MTHRADGLEANSAVVAGVHDVAVDDQAHRLIVAGWPQHGENGVGGDRGGRRATEPDNNFLASEGWRDVRDARRSLWHGHDGIGG